MGLRGKNKLTDRWDKHSYVVIEMPNEDVTVHKIQRESGDSIVTTLHRNMLLPFSVVPSSLDLGLFNDNSPSETSKTTAPVHK